MSAENHGAGSSRRVADAVVECLEAQGVDRIFCVPGESYLPVLDALATRQNIDVVTCRHEGSAGLAAVGDAKLTGKLGVVAVSRGPGMTNASIAVHLAQQDSVPLLVLVGQVDTPNLGRGAFQEVNYAQMFSGIAKWVGEISQSEQAPEIIARACAVARSGTPGPCIVVLPENVLSEQCTAEALHPLALPQSSTGQAALSQTVDLLKAAKKPVIIAGGVERTEVFTNTLLRFAEAWKVPVALTNKNQDLFPNEHPLWLGHIGYFPGSDVATGIAAADLIIAINTELGDVDTQNYKVPAPGVRTRRLVHVHPDPDVLGRLYATEVAVSTTGSAFLEQMANLAPPEYSGDDSWLRQVVDARQRVRSSPLADSAYSAVVQAIGDATPNESVITIDAGNFSTWVHRLLSFGSGRRMLSAACGAMGIAVPAALAASLRLRHTPVVAFVGDGGFLMTGNELATAVAERANLKIIVANNGSYSTIRMYQEKFYPGRPSATKLVNPDFAVLAAAFGARGFRVSSAQEAQSVVREALLHAGPCVIDVACDVEQILPGQTISDIRRAAAGN